MPPASLPKLLCCCRCLGEDEPVFMLEEACGGDLEGVLVGDLSHKQAEYANYVIEVEQRAIAHTGC